MKWENKKILLFKVLNETKNEKKNSKKMKLNKAEKSWIQCARPQNLASYGILNIWLFKVATFEPGDVKCASRKRVRVQLTEMKTEARINFCGYSEYVLGHNVGEKAIQNKQKKRHKQM